MKHQLLTAFLTGSLLLLLTTCRSVRPAKIDYGSYQIECVGDGSPQGTQLLRVWVYVDASDIRRTGIDEIRRCAVHGVIFKGYTGSGCTPQKPMVASPALELQRADFFEPFFNRDEAYNRYASEVRGNTMERTRAGKDFKISAIISVSKDMLRRDLEAAGILRGLPGGF
jgi:hypothetical protein